MLVANVSYLGYVTPPGGPDPHWKNCQYDVYAVFIVFNGFAFLFSLGATGVVIVLPWLYPSDEKKPAVDWWIGAGLILLLISIVSFTVAFLAAGLVTSGIWAPLENCDALPCEEYKGSGIIIQGTSGGLPCGPNQEGSMANVLSLNNVRGECFYVSEVAEGRSLSQSQSLVSYKNSGNADSTNFDPDSCYLVVQLLGPSDVDKFSTHTNRVLCTVSPSNTTVAGKGSLADALVDLMGNLWVVPGPGYGSKMYYMQIPTTKNWASCNSSDYFCACSAHMLKADLMFVTYTSQVYLASSLRLSGSDTGYDWSHFRTEDGHGSYDTYEAFGVPLAVYSPPVFSRDQIAVYDELEYRCSSSYYDSVLCAYHKGSFGSFGKDYKDIGGGYGYHRQCGQGDCHGVAVREDKQYIKLQFNAQGNFLMYLLTFAISALAFVLYLVIFIFVIRARRSRPAVATHPAAQAVRGTSQSNV